MIFLTLGHCLLTAFSWSTYAVLQKTYLNHRQNEENNEKRESRCHFVLKDKLHILFEGFIVRG